MAQACFPYYSPVRKRCCLSHCSKAKIQPINDICQRWASSQPKDWIQTVSSRAHTKLLHPMIHPIILSSMYQSSIDRSIDRSINQIYIAGHHNSKSFRELNSDRESEELSVFRKSMITCTCCQTSMSWVGYGSRKWLLCMHRHENEWLFHMVGADTLKALEAIFAFIRGMMRRLLFAKHRLYTGQYATMSSDK